MIILIEKKTKKEEGVEEGGCLVTIALVFCPPAFEVLNTKVLGSPGLWLALWESALVMLGSSCP